MPCPHCNSATCDYGSECRRGIFAPAKDTSYAPRATGLHKDTRKSSKRYHFESEHLFPMAATKQLFPGAKAGNEPTMSIAYRVHRGGQSGAGGGVSSTGSSYTAKDWATLLVATARSQGFAAALRLAAMDEANAHLVQGSFTREIADQIARVVTLHHSMGRLTAKDAGEICNEIIDYQFRKGQ